ncbi:MAG: hypothetical protein HY940_06690, partial [Gammaproteobacteria bacterium]|nr:hypothetical protein [Gammaproteobacteria bacterium]
MSLDIDVITKDMIAAAKGVVDDRWPTTKKYFESESKMYAQRLASIAKMFKDGLISEKRAKEHVEFQNEAWQTTLEAGVFQGSCRVNRFHYAAFWHSITSRSGLSMTAPIGDQFRVFPDHRSG